MSSLVQILDGAAQHRAEEITMETGQPVVLNGPHGSVPVGHPLSGDEMFELLQAVLSDEQQVELMVGNLVELKVSAGGVEWSLVAEPGVEGVVVRGRRAAVRPRSSAVPSLELPAASPFDAEPDFLPPPGPEESFTAGVLPPLDGPPETGGFDDPFDVAPDLVHDDPFADPFDSAGVPPGPPPGMGAALGASPAGPTVSPGADVDIPAFEDRAFAEPVTEPLDDDDMDGAGDFAMVPPTSTSRVTFQSSRPGAGAGGAGPVDPTAFQDDEDQLPPLDHEGPTRGADRPTPRETPAVGGGLPVDDDDEVDFDLGASPAPAVPMAAAPGMGPQGPTEAAESVAASRPTRLDVGWRAVGSGLEGAAAVEQIPEGAVLLLRGASGLELVDEHDPLCLIEGDDPLASGESSRGRPEGSWIVLAVDDPSVWLGWILRRLEEGHRLLVETTARSADGARRVLLGLDPGPRAEPWLGRFPLFYGERGAGGFALHRAVGHGAD